MPTLTTTGASSKTVPRPPARNCEIFEMSGSHRARRSGLGFPTRSFNPVVMKSAPARLTPKPSHPTFHSQHLRRHWIDLLCEPTAAPKLMGTIGERRRETPAMMAAGAASATRMTTVMETVSGSRGYEMSISSRPKTCLFPVILYKTPAAATVTLHRKEG